MPDSPAPRMRIALVGTRGVPARYGGFETAVEEVGSRLVERGHSVTVYCRREAGSTGSHLGMSLVRLPAVRRKSLETLSHTGLSALHLRVHGRHDVGIVFNAANALWLPLLRTRDTPFVTHVDGLEWARDKWGGLGRRYYRAAESLAVRWSDALIADAPGIADYYRSQFQARTVGIAYGAKILTAPPADRLAELGLRSGRFHVVIARFEPENHVDLAIEGYLRSGARLPLVVVGSAPYSDDYTQGLRALAACDARVRLLGPVWDQDLLDQLYAHALTYVHGHSVGGTNPSLLRAMGARTAVLAYDVGFNRDVLGAAGRFFRSPAHLALLLDAAESDLSDVARRARLLQERAAARYRWDDVTTAYEQMCARLVAGVRLRSSATGRRAGPSAPALADQGGRLGVDLGRRRDDVVAAAGRDLDTPARSDVGLDPFGRGPLDRGPFDPGPFDLDGPDLDNVVPLPRSRPLPAVGEP